MPKIHNQTVAYRTCFGTDAGNRVLSHLLIEAGMFDSDLKTTEEIAVENFAKKILKNLGIRNDPKQMTEFVNKLFEISYS